MTHQVFGMPDPGLTYRSRPSAYGVAFTSDGLAAVVHCEGKGYFLLGGGIDSGETPEDCVHREAREEVGAAVTVGELVCVGEEYRLDSQGDPFHPIGYVHLIELGEQVPGQCEKDHVLTWLPVEGCREKLTLPYQAWALEQCWKHWRNKRGERKDG